MRESLILVLKLFVITVVAGLVLGGAYTLTKEPIANQRLLAATAAREAVFSGAEFEAVEDIEMYDSESLGIDSVYTASKDGDMIGYVVEMVTQGYGGDINLTVGVDMDGKITGVSIGNHSETPGLGAKAKEKQFYSQFAGKSAALRVVKSAPADDEIQAITGATITSIAVKDGAAIAVDFVENFN